MPEPVETDEEFLQRLTAAAQSCTTDNAKEAMQPYLRWHLWDMMQEVDPQEFTPTELMVVKEVYAGAVSRKFASDPTPPRPTLRSIGGCTAMARRHDGHIPASDRPSA